MPSVPSLKLNNGASIPAIGLGNVKATSSYLSALKAGYRHIDTAWFYGTEKYVGEAIRESGIPREEIFVTTKLPPHHPGRVAQSIDESLKASGLDYFDLYLIHMPQVIAWDEATKMPLVHPDGTYEVLSSPTFNDTWKEMEEVLASGKAKAIGVSNFSIKTLEQLLTTAKVIPAVNQVEMHPYYAAPKLLEYCKSKGILITAYTPTGYAKVREDPTIVSLAAKYKVASVQIILAWHVARGCAAAVASENAERQKQNIDLPTLSEEDIAQINTLNRNERLCIYSPVDKHGTIFGWTLEQYGYE